MLSFSKVLGGIKSFWERLTYVSNCRSWFVLSFNSSNKIQPQFSPKPYHFLTIQKWASSVLQYSYKKAFPVLQYSYEQYN